MKPLSEVTAPILARLAADRARVTDATTAELRRMTDETNRTIDRLKAGDRQKPTMKETT